MKYNTRAPFPPFPAELDMLIRDVNTIIARYVCRSSDMLLIDMNCIDWPMLSRNPHPCAVALLCANRDRIDWWQLSMQTHPDIIAMMRTRQDKIDW